MKEIKNNTEFAALLKQDKPVLLDFYADWCGPCQTLLPIIEQLADKYQGDVIIAKVNVDVNTELATKFKVRSIPILFFLKDGGIVETVNGLEQRRVLEEKIEALRLK
jgi:thioredoxin 1